jgi:hypothetical protein
MTERRRFIKKVLVGLLSAVSVGKARSVSAVPRPALLFDVRQRRRPVSGDASPPLNPSSRITILKSANEKWFRKISRKPFASSEAMPGESVWDTRLLSFSKGLPHDSDGIVQKRALEALHKAIHSKRIKDFENLPVSGPKKLKNPLAGLALEFCGLDSQQYTVAKPPAPKSEEFAAELRELYWMALARDIPFTEYESSPLIAEAAQDLQGRALPYSVSVSSIFKDRRGLSLPGPFISQFLLKPYLFGPNEVDSRVQIATSKDYLTDRPTWLFAQNGFLPGFTELMKEKRYLTTGRDLAHYVILDEPSQGGIGAAMILKQMGSPLSSGNPYVASATMNGFVYFDFSHLLGLIHTAVHHALRAVWYQKWFVSRRLRPEELCGRIDATVNGRGESLVHRSLYEGAILEKIMKKYGSALLPVAVAEGCPLHPAYPGGHSAFLGATVTLLKAWFDEKAPFPEPIVPSADGSALVPYGGADADKMTVGSELDKMAWNIAVGRCLAGIHYRSDCEEGMRLGEATALSVLDHLRVTCPEKFSYVVTSFDKRRIVSRS